MIIIVMPMSSFFFNADGNSNDDNDNYNDSGNYNDDYEILAQNYFKYLLKKH